MIRLVVCPDAPARLIWRKHNDTINRNFLENVLGRLNLHPLSTERNMECFSSPSFSIAINGSSHGFFKGKRGLRQGEPMSPSIFNLCMEYLPCILSLRTCRQHFNYHPKCINLCITHLAFADELVLFGRGDLMSMQVLAGALQEFSACSGLEVNQGKSNIFIAGTMSLSQREETINNFGYMVAHLSVKYLGPCI